MTLLEEARKFFRYLLGKKSELEELDARDVVMAKTVLDIHRKRVRKEVVSVPLYALYQIHVLDRENAIQATRQRVETLRSCREELLEHRVITCDLLARYLPSVSWIKVVKEAPDVYLAFEGNGRIAAMQAVFEAGDELLVEVEEYVFRNPEKILRRLNRVRRMNGLLERRPGSA